MCVPVFFSCWTTSDMCLIRTPAEMITESAPHLALGADLHGLEGYV